jgi:hypothetical protein
MVYKERLDLEEHIWPQYPQASCILYLPQTIFVITKSILKKKSSAHHYHELNFWWLAREFPYFDKEKLEEKFPTECSVVEWSIDVIVDNYINATAGVLLCHDENLKVCKVARAQWLKRRELRLQKESYLGNNGFYAELMRSCGEFYHELKKLIGFTPIS